MAGSTRASGGRPCAPTASTSATSSSPTRRIRIPGPAASPRRRTPTVLGDYKLNKNVRYSAGIDQKILAARLRQRPVTTTTIRTSCRAGRIPTRSIGGVRPDPAFGNIISTVTDAEIIRHELFVNFNVSLMTPSPAANNATFNWRRLAAERQLLVHPREAERDGSVRRAGQRHAGHGMGPRAGRQPLPRNVGADEHAVQEPVGQPVGERVGRLRLHETTGFDDNQDGLLNDRPAGVGIWTLRGTPVWTLNTRLTYNLPIASAPAARRAAPAQRYRASLLRQRQQPDQSRQPDRLQRRDDVAVLHDARPRCRIRARWTSG